MNYQQESPTSSRLNNSSLIENESNVENEDYTCGLFNFRPKWLQKLARKQVFLAVFCLTSVIQGMYFTYIVSVLTTIERLYQLPSRTTGFIISSVEIGQISGSLSLTYFGGKGGHRPKMIGAGIILFAFANLLCSSPHFFLPSELERANPQRSILAGKSANLTANNEQLSKEEFLIKDKLCLLKKENAFDKIFGSFHSSSDKAKCNDSNEQTNKNKVTFLATCIFFTAAILVGFGTTAVNTLGIPYIDDNVAPKESPLYFAITIGIKIFGPVLGFLLGSICTSIYINFPLENGHGLTQSHPEWIGAWWLGVFILGIVIMFNSIFMMSFPRKLPSAALNRMRAYRLGEESGEYEEKTYKVIKSEDNKQNENYSKLHIEKQLNNNEKKKDDLICCDYVKQSEVKSEERSKDSEKQTESNSFFTTIKRLLNNRILLCRIASTVFHTLPVSGLYTFLPKYLEYQFRMTASDASFVSGIAGIMVMGLGIFTSGIFMRKYNPSPKFVSSWICIATFLYVCGMIMLMFLGCPLPKISDINVFNPSNAPNCPSCHCESNQFSPVCASNSITYLSPCLAGCTQFNRTDNEYNYLQCKCLSDQVQIIKNGFCDVECNNLFWYIILFSTIALLHSTTEVGAMLITLRSVRPQDKTVALGLVAFVSSLLGNFPCPTLYGAIIDTACIYWQKDCDTNGACRLFDPDKFRIYFHGLTAFFMFLAFLFDVCVWSMSSKVNFLEEEPHLIDSHNENTVNGDSSTNDLDKAERSIEQNKFVENELLKDGMSSVKQRRDSNDTNNNNKNVNQSSKSLKDNDGNNNTSLLIEDCKTVENATRTGESLMPT